MVDSFTNSFGDASSVVEAISDMGEDEGEEAAETAGVSAEGVLNEVRPPSWIFTAGAAPGGGASAVVGFSKA